MGRAAELKPEAIKNALAETKDYKGATGTISIDKDHNASKSVVIVQVKEKKFTFSSELRAK
jgi:branched-chain amino acid transport system substrate-binding protein